MKATTAISRAKKSKGVSSIKPPGDRAELRPYLPYVRNQRCPSVQIRTLKVQTPPDEIQLDQSRSMRNGRPSTIMLPGPISSSARNIRPSRPSALSARLTIKRFGEAIGEAARIRRAIEISSRCGLSKQAAGKALAVERLIPA